MADCPKGGVCDCVTPNNCIPYGAWDGYAKLHANAYLRTSTWSDNPQDDSRAAYLNVDRDSIPKGSWRTPSLRDVALTAPYMHDGSYATLEAVVDHYNDGADPMPERHPQRAHPAAVPDARRREPAGRVPEDADRRAASRRAHQPADAALTAAATRSQPGADVDPRRQPGPTIRGGRR